MRLRILHLEDNADDADLVRLSLARGGLNCDIVPVHSGDEFLEALQRPDFDVILSDSGVPGYDGRAALAAAHDRCPEVPFIVVSGFPQHDDSPQGEAMAAAAVAKSELDLLAPTIRSALQPTSPVREEELETASYVRGMQQLVAVVQRLTLARNLQSIMEIVRHAARNLVGADGATFVLPDGDSCFHAEEDAIESVDLLSNLERRVSERTGELQRRSAELEVLNRELEALSYSVAHDLRSPLITIDGFSQVLLDSAADRLDDTGRNHLERICGAVRRMHRLINDLLELSKVVRARMHHTSVDLSRMAEEITRTLRESVPARQATFVIADNLVAEGDASLLRIALESLLSNAWKFTSRTANPRIEFGACMDHSGRRAFYVRDNGVGFDPRRRQSVQPLLEAAQRIAVPWNGHRPGHGAAHRSPSQRRGLGRGGRRPRRLLLLHAAGDRTHPLIGFRTYSAAGTGALYASWTSIDGCRWRASCDSIDPSPIRLHVAGLVRDPHFVLPSRGRQLVQQDVR